MKVKELRALLDLLPERFDYTEVCVTAHQGLRHVGTVHLARQRTQRRWFPGLDGVSDDRLERKLTIEGSGVLWYNRPSEWRLGGWWPAGAEDIGLPGEEGVRG